MPAPSLYWPDVLQLTARHRVNSNTHRRIGSKNTKFSLVFFGDSVLK